MQEYKFKQPDGTFLVVTQNKEDPTVFASRYEDGTTLSDRIKAMFDAGEMKK